MSEDHGKTAESDRDMGADLQRAAVILQDARKHARQQLTYQYPVLLTTWGLMYLLGYGVAWLSVRGQHPYVGPTPTALLALTIIVVMGLATTVIVVGRAVSGVGGSSARQRRCYVLSAIAGFAGLFTLEAALDHAGASRAVIGVYGAVAPILLTGVICALGAAAAGDWTVFGLGIWLVVVAAGGAFAGPASVWAVAALAVGLAFLALAAARFRRHA